MAHSADIYAAWQKDPESFWAEAAQAVDWTQAPRTSLDASAAPL